MTSCCHVFRKLHIGACRHFDIVLGFFLWRLLCGRCAKAYLCVLFLLPSRVPNSGIASWDGSMPRLDRASRNSRSEQHHAAHIMTVSTHNVLWQALPLPPLPKPELHYGATSSESTLLLGQPRPRRPVKVSLPFWPVGDACSDLLKRDAPLEQPMVQLLTAGGRRQRKKNIAPPNRVWDKA